jgi:hypothetical protein
LLLQFSWRQYLWWPYILSVRRCYFRAGLVYVQVNTSTTSKLKSSSRPPWELLIVHGYISRRTVSLEIQIVLPSSVVLALQPPLCPFPADVSAICVCWDYTSFTQSTQGEINGDVLTLWSVVYCSEKSNGLHYNKIVVVVVVVLRVCLDSWRFYKEFSRPDLRFRSGLPLPSPTYLHKINGSYNTRLRAEYS